MPCADHIIVVIFVGTHAADGTFLRTRGVDQVLISNIHAFQNIARLIVAGFHDSQQNVLGIYDVGLHKPRLKHAKSHDAARLHVEIHVILVGSYENLMLACCFLQLLLQQRNIWLQALEYLTCVVAFVPQDSENQMYRRNAIVAQTLGFLLAKSEH